MFVKNIYYSCHPCDKGVYSCLRRNDIFIEELILLTNSE